MAPQLPYQKDLPWWAAKRPTTKIPFHRRRAEQPREAPHKQLILFLLLFLILTACTRPASTQPVTLPPSPTLAQPTIQVEKVQVNDRVSIEIDGSAALAEGQCLQTDLLENGVSVGWWPKNTCIAPDAHGHWQMVIRLGHKGAPQTLDSQAEYEIHAWPMDHPEDIQARFPFDLQGPP